MAARLKSAGFAVTLIQDAGHKRMETALKTFGRDLKPASTAVVFYAGHGVQVNGVSYLLPIDAEADDPAALKYEAVNLNMVLDVLDKDGAGAGLKIVILDCCRDDPFGRGWRGSRTAAGVKGMAAPTSTPRGTVLCFATDPGEVARDGQGTNSPYTNGLLAHLFTPGVEIDRALRRAGAAVQKVTNREQNPWRNSNFNGEFAFVPGGSGPVPPPPLQVTPRTATKERPFVNSLGMKFVPVPGTDVLFCIWETRVRDFAAFVNDPASGYDYAKGDDPYVLTAEDGWKQSSEASWKNPGFPQTDDHPVTCVSWEDARAFCTWLSRQNGGRYTYRLPRDHEWSLAVGIGSREDAAVSPEDKDEEIEGVYPWGTAWPPPATAGNYGGGELVDDPVWKLKNGRRSRDSVTGLPEPRPLHHSARIIWESTT